MTTWFPVLVTLVFAAVVVGVMVTLNSIDRPQAPERDQE